VVNSGKFVRGGQRAADPASRVGPRRRRRPRGCVGEAGLGIKGASSKRSGGDHEGFQKYFSTEKQYLKGSLLPHGGSDNDIPKRIKKSDA